MVYYKFVLSTVMFFLLLSYNSGEVSAQSEYYQEVNIKEDVEVFIKTYFPIMYIKSESKSYGEVKDKRYIYKFNQVGSSYTYLILTKRELPNGDFFLFTQIKNRSKQSIDVEILFNQYGNVESSIARFDRFPIKYGESPTIGLDPTSYPVGLMNITHNDTLQSSIMVGKTYQSKEQSLLYPTGNVSKTREFIAETNPLSIHKIGLRHLFKVKLHTDGNDIAEHWLLYSNEPLFNDEKTLVRWMIESATNYRKTNNWYTENGPYNKMVLTVEPQSKTKLGYGRTLLMVKEDKALDWYTNTDQRYFYNLLYNSFANLQKFKGEKLYWETEVTSLYLKNLFGITAPFIDTRFNEQTALFLKNAGGELNLTGYDEALYDYADLLVHQVKTKRVINVDNGAIFIPDYFPVHQKVITHMSLNHGLGGMNLLLEAYQLSNNLDYLHTAEKIQKGLEVLGEQWIRENGDLWYKVTPELKFVGSDYRYLTLEDLLKTYSLWNDINPEHNYVIEMFIRSKVDYLKTNSYPLTNTLKQQLSENGFNELVY